MSMPSVNDLSKNFTTPNVRAHGPRNASRLPLIVAGVFVTFSVALYLLGSTDKVEFSYAGYLFTPLGVVFSLAWGQTLDIRGRRDVWYSPSTKLLVVLKILAATSFLIGMLHMWRIATHIAQMVAN
ncbi:MAG: hypothetical protein WCO08_06875 [Actinomycetes bacterium]